MTFDEFRSLKVGDLVRHKASAHAMTVTHTYPNLVFSRTVVAYNATEWDKVSEDGEVVSRDG